MSCESKMSLAALAARFTWSLIRRCNDEWTCSSRLEALPKTHKGRLVWETSTNKIYHVAQERILICLMFSQLQCHETAINLMMHMFTRLTHQRHLFFLIREMFEHSRCRVLTPRCWQRAPTTLWERLGTSAVLARKQLRFWTVHPKDYFG